MVEKVINFNKPTPIDESLVSMLTELLEEAKKGDLLSVAGVYLDKSSEPFIFTSCEVTDELRMLGAIEILKDDFKFEHLTETEYE